VQSPYCPSLPLSPTQPNPSSRWPPLSALPPWPPLSATGSPPPSSTSVGTGTEGPISPVFGPASPSSVAAFESRVGDASKRCAAGAAFERRSVTVSDRGSGAAFVTVTQRAPMTLATSKLRANRGFCPRTIEVNPNPNHKSLRAIGDVLFNGLLWIISLCTRCCTLGYVLLNGFFS
jgi:hypothetical protein